MTVRKTKYLDALLDGISETMRANAHMKVTLVNIDMPKQSFLDKVFNKKQGNPSADIAISMADKNNNDLYVFGQIRVAIGGSIEIAGVECPKITTTEPYKTVDD